MSKKSLPRLPKVLADELNAAINDVQLLGQSEAMRLLAVHRENRRNAIAAWGITAIGAPVPGLTPIPLEHLARIQRLDDIFQKLHRYHAGGAHDYAAKDVESLISSFRRLGQDGRKADHTEIINFLKSRNYSQSDNKKALELAAVEKFEVSLRTVQRAAQAGNLTRAKNKSTAK